METTKNISNNSETLSLSVQTKRKTKTKIKIQCYLKCEREIWKIDTENYQIPDI